MKNLVDHLKKDVTKLVLVVLLFMNFGMGSVNLLSGHYSVPTYMQSLIVKFDLVYMYVTNEMVRFIEKQYTKIIEKPDDFYITDCQYAIDVIWPAIPENKKTASLMAKYDFIKCKYDESLLALQLQKEALLLSFNR